MRITERLRQDRHSQLTDKSPDQVTVDFSAKYGDPKVSSCRINKNRFSNGTDKQ